MVKRITYILQANLEQYKSLLAMMQDPGTALPILDVRNRSQHDELLSESERLLHNVLAAIKSRVDLSRAFRERHLVDDEDLIGEYVLKVRQYFNNPATKFLDRLRNHMTHNLLPVARTQQTFKQGGPFEFTFLLDSVALLKLEWPTDVREWIAAQGSDIRIIDVLDAYCQRASELDRWLFGEIRRKHANELADYERAVHAFNAEYDRLFGTG